MNSRTMILDVPSAPSCRQISAPSYRMLLDSKYQSNKMQLLSIFSNKCFYLRLFGPCQFATSLTIASIKNAIHSSWPERFCKS